MIARTGTVEIAPLVDLRDAAQALQPQWTGEAGVVRSAATYRVDAATPVEVSSTVRKAPVAFDAAVRMLSRDADGRSIESIHVVRALGSTDGFLAAALSPGDTSLSVAGDVGWSNEPGGESRKSLAWYGYVADDGTPYDNFTYTRNVLPSAWEAGAISYDAATDTTTVVLSQPWDGPTLAAGAAVRNADAAMPGFDAVRDPEFVRDVSGIQLDDQFSAWSATLDGVVSDGRPDGTRLLPGAATVQLEVAAIQSWDDFVIGPEGAAPLSGEPAAPVATFDGETTLTVGRRGRTLADFAVPVATQSGVTLSATVSSEAGRDKHYVGFASYDVAGRLILPHHVRKVPGAVDTTLAADLNPGDTQIVLTDATGWSSGGPTFTRAIAWYGQSDKAGRTYPAYTYTRNVLRSAWRINGITGNVITLREPWAGPALPVGEPVRNAQSGSTYDYVLVDREQLPTTPQSRTATISGTWTGGTPVDGQFRPGTAAIRPVVLSNYDAALADETLTVSDVRVTRGGGLMTDVDGAGVLTATLDVLANDADAIDLLAVSGARHGSATHDGLRVHYVSQPGFVGTERLTYFVRTSTGDIRSATVTLTATGDHIALDTDLQAALDANDPNGNRPPNARDDGPMYVALANRPLIADGVALPGVLDNDRDREPVAGGGFADDVLAARLLDGPQHGSLRLNPDGTFDYRPDRGFSGVDHFRYEATDGLATDASTVSITVFEDAADLTLDKLADVQLAHLDYEQTYGHFWLNPARDASSMPNRWDDEGRAKLSWRVYLLPFLGYGDLFERFDLDADWDSPQNLPLLAEMPDVFRLPGEPAGLTDTRIQAFTGNDAVFGRDSGYSSGGVDYETAASLFQVEIGQGAQNVLMTGVAAAGVPWTAPLDIEFDPDAPLAPLDGSSGELFVGRVDGSAVALPAGVPDATLASLVTVATVRDVHTDVVSAPPWVDTVHDEELFADAGDVLREEARRSDVRSPSERAVDAGHDNDLRQIGLAMFNFADTFGGRFPIDNNPNYFDEDGRPLLSWRVHVLPYLGYGHLFNQFDLEKPWDDPHNLALLDFMPDVFRSPGDAAATTDTRMQTFTGPDAPFEFHASGDQIGPRFRDFRDGVSNTILVAEVGQDRAVPWTAPQDAAFDVADPLAALGQIDGDVRFVAADGQTGRLHADIAADDFSAAVTRNGGEGFDLPTLLRRQHQFRDESFETRIDAVDRLKWLSIAMNNYEETFASFPITELNFRTFDPDTHRSYLSWRVHILPFLDHADLYEQFDLEKPWDDPQNLAAAAHMPDVFRSLGDPADSTTTRFQTFFGPGAAWGDRLTTMNDGRQGFAGPAYHDLRDGPSNTAMIVETGADRAVLWTRPDDVPFDEANLAATVAALGNVGAEFLLAMFDGSVFAAPGSIDPATFATLVTANGREDPDPALDLLRRP